MYYFELCVCVCVWARSESGISIPPKFNAVRVDRRENNVYAKGAQLRVCTKRMRNLQLSARRPAQQQRQQSRAVITRARKLDESTVFSGIFLFSTRAQIGLILLNIYYIFYIA